MEKKKKKEKEEEIRGKKEKGEKEGNKTGKATVPARIEPQSIQVEFSAIQ